MNGRGLRELTPVLLAVTLVVLIFAMIFEVVISTARGVDIDPVAFPVLGTLAGACITALGGFWAAESKPRRDPPPPPPPPQAPRVEETGDVESDRWNRDHGYLEFRGGRRWKPC